MKDNGEKETPIDHFNGSMDEIDKAANQLGDVGYALHRVGMTPLADEILEVAKRIGSNSIYARQALNAHLRDDIKTADKHIASIAKKVMSK
jgi:hypothetical protein